MNRFFSQKSAAERGTVYHCKQVFGMRSLQKDAMHNFHKVEEIVHLMTEGNVCLLALKLLKMKTVDDKPLGSPYSKSMEARSFIDTSAQQIVSEFWQEASAEEIKGIRNVEPDWRNDPERVEALQGTTGDAYEYCLCKQEVDGAIMVQCSNVTE